MGQPPAAGIGVRARIPSLLGVENFSRRPNPIGISIVRPIEIDDNILHIQDVDIVDGTPLLDVKPYVPEFDVMEGVKIGWLEDNVHKLSASKDDGRFVK